MADLVSLLQLKLCMVQLLGFQRCQMASGRGTFRVVFDGLGQLSSSPVVHSCFQGLMRALDTSLPCDLPPACMVESNDDSVAQGLLGSVFVDVVIQTINQIDFLQTPYIVARCLLTSLVIILAKVSRFPNGLLSLTPLRFTIPLTLSSKSDAMTPVDLA
jgi:hypothetical protein